MSCSIRVLAQESRARASRLEQLEHRARARAQARRGARLGLGLDSGQWGSSRGAAVGSVTI